MIRVLVLLLLFAMPAMAQTNPNASFNLVNRSDKPVKELYASSAGQTNFGTNRLKAILAPGARFAVLLPPNGTCLYDIRVVFTDGTRQDYRAVNTCRTDDVVVAAAMTKPSDDPSFHLTNRGTLAIAELTATPPGQPRGPSLLESPIAPGGNRDIHLPRGKGCVFDLRLVLADKTAKEKKGADLCKISELPFP
jgi:hypothetical protein